MTFKLIKMCSIRGDVTAGEVHKVSHNNTNANFTVAVYGLAVSGYQLASYAYPAGIIYSSAPSQAPTQSPGEFHISYIFCKFMLTSVIFL